MDELARQVLLAAEQRGLRLATAESCTGGLIASLLTDQPGCSHVFEAGFVTYSDEAKTALLGVPAEMIASCGAVSAEVARAMALGALTRSNADLAVAVTGFADGSAPGGRAGEVFLACMATDRDLIERRLELGERGRDAVRDRAASEAIELFRLQIVRDP